MGELYGWLGEGHRALAPEEILARMARLEAKLDMLLMSSRMEGQKTPKQAMEVAQARDISGSGMCIASSMTMSDGWHIKIVFELDFLTRI